MTAHAKTPAKPVKDVVRLQFDVRRAQVDIIDNLVNVCGLSSKKELFSNAMALMKWAVQETQKGRRIASYDPERDEIEMVALPALDLSTHPDTDTLSAAAASHAPQERVRDGERTVASKQPKLDLV